MVGKFAAAGDGIPDHDRRAGGGLEAHVVSRLLQRQRDTKRRIGILAGADDRQRAIRRWIPSTRNPGEHGFDRQTPATGEHASSSGVRHHAVVRAIRARTNHRQRGRRKVRVGFELEIPIDQRREAYRPPQQQRQLPPPVFIQPVGDAGQRDPFEPGIKSQIGARQLHQGAARGNFIVHQHQAPRRPKQRLQLRIGQIDRMVRGMAVAFVESERQRTRQATTGGLQIYDIVAPRSRRRFLRDPAPQGGRGFRHPHHQHRPWQRGDPGRQPNMDVAHDAGPHRPVLAQHLADEQIYTPGVLAGGVGQAALHGQILTPNGQDQPPGLNRRR